VHDYVYGKTNIYTSIYANNSPAFFPAVYSKQPAAKLSWHLFGDIGVTIIDRKHEYAQWSDFPIPMLLPTLAQQL